MIIRFNGWGHDAGSHQFFAIPVTKGDDKYHEGEMLDPLVWHDSTRAFCRIICMDLHGDYLVEFDFDDKELKNWLLQYVKAEPRAAKKLLSEAILALPHKPQEEESIYTNE